MPGQTCLAVFITESWKLANLGKENRTEGGPRLPKRQTQSGSFWAIFVSNREKCQQIMHNFFQAESVTDFVTCGNRIMSRDLRLRAIDAVTRQLLVEVNQKKENNRKQTRWPEIGASCGIMNWHTSVRNSWYDAERFFSLSLPPPPFQPVTCFVSVRLLFCSPKVLRRNRPTATLCVRQVSGQRAIGILQRSRELSCQNPGLTIVWRIAFHCVICVSVLQPDQLPHLGGNVSTFTANLELPSDVVSGSARAHVSVIGVCVCPCCSFAPRRILCFLYATLRTAQVSPSLASVKCASANQMRKLTVCVVSGDVMGPSLSGLDKLLRLPTGCGEQNMIGFTPNIYVLQYLISTNQLTPEIETKAKSHMKTGEGSPFEITSFANDFEFLQNGALTKKSGVFLGGNFTVRLLTKVIRCWRVSSEHL